MSVVCPLGRGAFAAAAADALDALPAFPVHERAAAEYQRERGERPHLRQAGHQSDVARIRAFDGVTNWSREYRPNQTYLGCTIAKGILDDSDFEQWDEEGVRAKIEAYVSDFAQNQYPKIRDAVTQCFREFEASNPL